MKRVFLTMIAGVCWTLAALAVDPIYINNDNRDCLTNAPQIDATIFVNNGSLCYDLGIFGFSPIPFTTQNTSRYTNNGSLSGASGFWFEFFPPVGVKRPADVFFNSRRGSIEATDPGQTLFISGTGGSTAALNVPVGSYILARADTIVNQGLLSIGAAGMMQLQGKTVTLSNSALNVKPLSDASIFNTFFRFSSSTNFIPDPGIYDDFWGIEQNTNVNVNAFVTGAGNFLGVTTPPTRITNDFGAFGSIILSLAGPQSYGHVQFTSPTNITVQAIFVKTADPGVRAQARWTRSTYSSDSGFDPKFMTAIVELSSTATNVITGDAYTNFVYLIDQLGSGTNVTTSTNLNNDTLRPANYIVSRAQPFGFIPGVSSNITVDRTIFYNPAYSNIIVTNIQSAYSATVESIASRVPIVPGASITNTPGRIEIFADTLDMNRTRLRAEGVTRIQASNFLGSSNALLDSPTFHYDLAKAAGPLRLTNIAPRQVDRFHGTFECWSGVWTNQSVDLVTSNVTEIAFHVLVLDASGMSSTQPVTITDFIARRTDGSTQTEILDPLLVTDHMRVEADTLIVRNDLDLSSNPFMRWDVNNFPNLKIFTNSGNITLNGLADFGGQSSAPSAAPPYQTFVNSGRISAFSSLIEAEEFENSGAIISGQPFVFSLNGLFNLTNFFFTNIFTDSIGPISVRARSAKLQGGSFKTLGDVTLTSHVTKMDHYGIDVGGTVRFDARAGAPNGILSLNDSGPEAQNTVVVRDGFHYTRPGSGEVLGDLYGTTFTSFAPRFAVVESSWAALDRGTNAAGFTNNQVIGHLTLDFGDRFSQFVFSPESVPSGARAAIYVDVLELTGFVPSTLEDGIVLNGMDLYFADLRVNDPNPNYVTNLDNHVLSGGVAHWAKYYPGPNSSVDVAISATESVKMNRLSRESTVEDTDGDGIPNGLDDFPLTPNASPISAALQAQLAAAGRIDLIWVSVPGGKYRLESAESLKNPKWTLVTELTNSGTTPRTESVQVQRPASARYYRLASPK